MTQNRNLGHDPDMTVIGKAIIRMFKDLDNPLTENQELTLLGGMVGFQLTIDTIGWDKTIANLHRENAKK